MPDRDGAERIYSLKLEDAQPGADVFLLVRQQSVAIGVQAQLGVLAAMRGAIGYPVDLPVVDFKREVPGVRRCVGRHIPQFRRLD